MRIGVDVGGTKIEAIALDAKGTELQRIRTATPKGEYEGTICRDRGAGEGVGDVDRADGDGGGGDSGYDCSGDRGW